MYFRTLADDLPAVEDGAHHAAGAHLVQRPGKEVVVDQEIVLVIPLVRNLELTKWDVADGNIKETIRKIRCLKSLHRNAVLLIKLLSNTTGYAVQFHTIHMTSAHFLRKQTHEVANATAGFQDIAGLEAQIG